MAIPPSPAQAALQALFEAPSGSRFHSAPVEIGDAPEGTPLSGKGPCYTIALPGDPVSLEIGRRLYVTLEDNSLRASMTPLLDQPEVNNWPRMVITLLKAPVDHAYEKGQSIRYQQGSPPLDEFILATLRGEKKEMTARVFQGDKTSRAR